MRSGTPTGKAPSPSGRASWRPVGFYFAANVLFGAGLWAHAFLYNFYLDALGLDEGVMGFAAAALTAGGLSALLPAGALLDRWGAGPTYVVAAALASVGLAAGAFAERPALIYAAAFLAGGGAATWRVAMGPALMRIARGSLRARAFSWNVALLLGSGAAWTALAGLGPELGQTFVGLGALRGYRWTLLAGAAVTLAAAPVFVLAGSCRRAAGRGQARRAWLEPFRKLPNHLFVWVGVVLLWMTAGGLVLPFFNLYFERVQGLPVAGIGMVFAGAQAATALVLIASGELARSVGPRRALAWWTAVMAPALWILAVVAGPVGVAVGLYALIGAVPPATNPLIDQILLEDAPDNLLGIVSSLRNVATESSGFLGAAVGGLVLEAAGFGALFGASGAVAAVGAAALLLAFRPERRAHSEGG